MFVFPWYALNDKIKIINNNYNEEKLQISRTDNMRSLNVPFGINIMKGGRFEGKDNIFLKGVFENERFHAQRKDVNNNSIDRKMIFRSEWKIEMHQHDYFELMYVLEGTVEQKIENSFHIYKKGQACFMNRNTRHCEVSGEDFFVVYLCLSKEYVRKLLQVTNDREGIIYRFLDSNVDEKARYTKNYLFFDSINLENSIKPIYELFEKMSDELIEKKPGYLVIFHGLIERLFGTLEDKEKYVVSHISLNSSVEEALFTRIKEIIENDLAKCSRTDLSKKLNYSGDYLNRIVKKYTGLNITQYCQRVSLLKAKTLLCESDMSISSIISSIGFKNRTHFYELFKEQFGILPNELRKLNK